MTPTRVLLATNVLTPYRVPFYTRLGMLPGVDLFVAHGSSSNPRTGVADGDNRSFQSCSVRNLERRVGPITIRWQAGVLRALRTVRPDVLIVIGEVGTVSSWLLCAVGRLTGAKVVTWTSGFEPQSRGSWAFRIKRVAVWLYLRLSHEYLVYSTRARDALIAYGIQSNRIGVSFNGLEVTRRQRSEDNVREAAARRRADADLTSEMLYLYVGKMVPKKRVDLLLRAFAELSNRESSRCVLWLVGDGTDREALEALSRALDTGSVKFWGEIVDAADEFFAAADCFVLPGLGGLALNQAMFYGVPCICSQADGTEDDLVLDGETGLRFRSGDARSLADAMARARELRESGGLERMGNAARELIMTRSNVDQMVATFDGVIRGRSR